MLKDISEITKNIFVQFIDNNKELESPRSVYDVYRALESVVDNAKLVSEHYLALDFTEGYLENSSWGKPSDKWRRFFNEDLESLNKSLQKYLLSISYLSLVDDERICGGFMAALYNPKSSYAFIRDEYSIGFIEPCSLTMISIVLDTKVDNKTSYIKKFFKTELATYEQRLALQEEIRAKTVFLEANLAELKAYIKNNISLDDLI